MRCPLMRHLGADRGNDNPEQENATMEPKTKRYAFQIRGFFNVNADCIPLPAEDGDIVAFRLPNGRVVELVAALQFEDGEQISYSTEMEKIGFDLDEYDNPTFSEFDG